jgi:hypothetical protein
LLAKEKHFEATLSRFANPAGNVLRYLPDWVAGGGM